MIALRPYQIGFINSIRAAMARGVKRVMGVAPTGSGKTVCFAYITANAGEKRKRVYIVAHRARIVKQISGALSKLGVPHGMIAPRHSPTEDLIQVAMVQTLARRIEKLPAPDLLVVDEAHHGTAGSWRALVDAWPDAFVLGVTATPERLDGTGLGEVFDAMTLGPSMRELIEGGFLASYRYLAPPSEVDLSRVASRGGDFAPGQLVTEIDKPTITGDAVSHYRQHLAPRTAIAFCVTVEHSEHVAAQFRQAGIAAASVDGKMAPAEVDAILEALGTGEIRVVTSCDLISEGVDVPDVGGVILLRPTKSLTYYLQAVGRALRPKSDGMPAVILDHVGNVHRHGMPDAEREWSLDGRSKRGGAADGLRTCKVCFQCFPAGTVQDPCGEDGCLFDAAGGGGGKSAPEQVEGQLSVVGGTESGMSDNQYWAALREARSLQDFERIGRERGYAPGWARVRWNLRQKRVAA